MVVSAPWDSVPILIFVHAIYKPQLTCNSICLSVLQHSLGSSIKMESVYQPQFVHKWPDVKYIGVFIYKIRISVLFAEMFLKLGPFFFNYLVYGSADQIFQDLEKKKKIFSFLYKKY